MGIDNFRVFIDEYPFYSSDGKNLYIEWTNKSLKPKFKKFPIVLCIDSIALLYKYMRYFGDNITFTEEDLNLYDSGEYEKLENKYFTREKIVELANLGVQYLFALIPNWLIDSLHEIIIFIDGIAPASKLTTSLRRNNKLIASKHLILSRRIRAIVAKEFHQQLEKIMTNYVNCFQVKFVECKMGEGERLCLLEAKKRAILCNILILANDYDIMSGMLLINANLQIWTIKMKLDNKLENKFMPSPNQIVHLFDENLTFNWSHVFKWPKFEMKNRLLLFFSFHFVSNDYIHGIISGTDSQYKYLLSCYQYIFFHTEWKKYFKFNQLIQNIIDNCQPIEDNKPYIEMYHFYLQLFYGFIFCNSNYGNEKNLIDQFFTLIKNDKKIEIDLQIRDLHKDLLIVRDVLNANLWYLGYCTCNVNPTIDNYCSLQFDYLYNFDKKSQFQSIYKHVDLNLKWNQENYTNQHCLPESNVKNKYALALKKLYNQPPLSICIEGNIVENNLFPNLLSQLIYYYFQLL